MLEYNEVRERKLIIYGDEPHEVVESQVSRKQQRKPQNQVKLRNLLNGRVIAATFHAADRVEEADVSSKEIKFLYRNKQKNEFWFCDASNPANRFTIPPEIIGDSWKYLKENMVITAKIFEVNDEEKIIGLTLPIKVELKVVEAPPAIRGDTASGGGKQVTLETSAQVTVPFFIETGDVVRVNTETGEYTERVSK